MKNYIIQKLWKLLDAAREGLPVCTNKWNTVGTQYNKWAKQIGAQSRT